ncbi:hypothetical protein [Actinoplanes sp. TFC3]|uniref:hypothetical protein n=1 Tax=Actinoplanes sp. TFC3 TaxID=1710355 RepID=UPI000AFA8FFF|nr:hypothetical protein [Actinoplanes sp. TFC3]
MLPVGLAAALTAAGPGRHGGWPDQGGTNKLPGILKGIGGTKLDKDEAWPAGGWTGEPWQ